MRLSVLFFLLLHSCLAAQTYSSWLVGDTTDVSTAPQRGIVLAGGGGDNDDAMKWMLERANGGDVLVLRASGSDGYNDYFFSELGITVNSVETIRFDHPDAAYDEYVLKQLSNAELVFLAGGNQHDYYEYWVDTPVEDTLAKLISEKGITIGGTSAGMAILGEAFYAPPGGSADAAEALSDPFHPDMQLIEYGSFLHLPWLSKVITDTHYDQRERAGRHFVFMARLTNQYLDRFFGIACNEYTAVCIDEEGIARVFGEFPDYDDYAYFLQGNCQDEFLPEVLVPGTPVTWNRNNAAVKACRVPGTPDGENFFDLSDWQTSLGGTWWNWYAIGGEFSKVLTNDSDCNSPAVSMSIQHEGRTITVSPVPFNDYLLVKFDQPGGSSVDFRIIRLDGQVIKTAHANYPETRLELHELTPGIYLLQLIMDDQLVPIKIVKQ
ncbi:MAG: T9SS C-terminal target domain-containing protein [Bacteroidetes bacterium]|nr:MAG: T9SS C-terminal target domain-containing protein [Bacteroidota bacterium]